jgi:hypothetical protein
MRKFRAFASKSQALYQDQPYHNAMHAADITQTLHWFLQVLWVEEITTTFVEENYHERENYYLCREFIGSRASELAPSKSYAARNLRRECTTAPAHNLICIAFGSPYLSSISRPSYAWLLYLMCILALNLTYCTHVSSSPHAFAGFIASPQVGGLGALISPTRRLACVLAAIVHDIGHPGKVYTVLCICYSIVYMLLFIVLYIR